MEKGFVLEGDPLSSGGKVIQGSISPQKKTSLAEKIYELNDIIDR